MPKLSRDFLFKILVENQQPEFLSRDDVADVLLGIIGVYELCVCTKTLQRWQ